MRTLLGTKKRIASISSTYKVTSAMKLVSSVKLRGLMNKMEHARYFVKEIKDVFAYVSSVNKDNNSIYFNEVKEGNKLFVIITSTLGLCGSYNYNIFDVLDDKIDENDTLLIVGQKGLNHYKDHKNIVDLDYKSNDPILIAEHISKYVLSNFEKGKYSQVNLVYTHYKNSISFTPFIERILPISDIATTNENNIKDCLIEPSKKEVLNELVPLYVSSLFKGRLIESFTSEQVSRRNAMENASDNAKEIIDELKLEFNKARQAQITTEIIDIVGAANAQKGEE